MLISGAHAMFLHAKRPAARQLHPGAAAPVLVADRQRLDTILGQMSGLSEVSIKPFSPPLRDSAGQLSRYESGPAKQGRRPGRLRRVTWIRPAAPASG